MYNQRLKPYLKYPGKNCCAMKRFLFPLLATLAFPNAVNAEVPYEIHNRCINANDYFGCVEANKIGDNSKNKNEEIIIYQNPFNSLETCAYEAMNRDLDPKLVCPPCQKGLPMSDSDMRAANNGECIPSDEQDTWKLKKIGCSFLGIALLNPQFIAEPYNNNLKTCFD